MPARAATARALAGALLLLALLAGGACATDAPAPPPSPAPPAPAAVVVRELALDSARVARLPGLPDSLGIDLAREIAEELERLGLTARAREAGGGDDAASAGEWIVEGSVRLADGGSLVGRTLTPWPAGWGAARCRLAVVVRGAGEDEQRGQRMRFQQDATARRSVWAEPGGSVVDRCLKVAAIESARRIAARAGGGERKTK